jgi:large subunit ribosomal protein L15
MNLSTLAPIKGSIKNRKRVGRGHGSGLGRSSGRGDKGAGQRSGFKRRPWFEGGQMSLSRRLPKRGFTNIFKKEFQIVNLSSLEGIKKDSLTINDLKENGLIKSLLIPVKILGDGAIKKKLIIEANYFSTMAKEKIVKAGGTCKVL